MNAPILPLSPYERLGWMRYFQSLKCRKTCCKRSFQAGKIYAMSVRTVRVTTRERRRRRDGLFESVELAGCDLEIVLTAGNGWRHRFLDKPQASHPIVHNFEFLVEHFSIPQVPDIATLNPQGFETYKARLRALES